MDETTDITTPDEVTPNFKGDAPAKKAPAAKKAATKKAPAAKKAATKKAPAAKKAAPAKEGGIQRAPSTISKEGTQKDEFTGEELPVTAFPTSRQPDGTYKRGTVARRNLAAWREWKAQQKATAAKGAAKKAPAAKKAATKKAPAAG